MRDQITYFFFLGLLWLKFSPTSNSVATEVSSCAISRFWTSLSVRRCSFSTYNDLFRDFCPAVSGGKGLIEHGMLMNCLPKARVSLVTILSLEVVARVFKCNPILGNKRDELLPGFKEIGLLSSEVNFLLGGNEIEVRRYELLFEFFVEPPANSKVKQRLLMLRCCWDSPCTSRRS